MAGSGIGLIIIGAIIAFALNVHVSWVNLTVLGEILMAGGVIMVIVGAVVYFRGRSTTTTSSHLDSYGNESLTERRTDGTGYPD